MLNKMLIVLGKLSSPYLYMKECDIYVQPSRYEGISIGFREAQIFYKSSRSFCICCFRKLRKRGIDGINVPMGINGCANSLAKFMHDK